jgi:hypothetical protein
VVDEEVHEGKYDNEWLLPRSVDGCFPPESFA